MIIFSDTESCWGRFISVFKIITTTKSRWVDLLHNYFNDGAREGEDYRSKKHIGKTEHRA